MGCRSSKIASEPELTHQELNYRGMLYFMQNDLNCALDDFNYAILRNPKFAEALCNRAIVHQKLENIEAAYNDLHKAFKLNPQLAANIDISVLKKLYQSSAQFYNALKKFFTFKQRLSACYEGETPAEYEDLYDPITFEIMDDPISLSSGHTYDRKTIQTWFLQQGNPENTICPLSRNTINYLEFQQIKPHINTKKRLEKFINEKETLGQEQIEQERRLQYSKKALLQKHQREAGEQQADDAMLAQSQMP